MKNGWMGQNSNGQAVLEMAVVIPILALLLAASFAFAPLIYIKLAVQQAAYDCALSAAQSLDAETGRFQGTASAKESISSFNLQSARAEIHVNGTWGRSGRVTCEVQYRIAASAFPFHGLIPLPDSLVHTIILPAQVNKSEWR
ncbi:MAG: pilus assembly protein [Anaerolineales bacterium]|nr:pilus assembly protein [Anaerolineales bacterium]